MSIRNSTILANIGRDILFNNLELTDCHGIDTSNVFKYIGIYYRPKELDSVTNLIKCEILGDILADSKEV